MSGKILLSARKANRLKSNYTVNHKGKRNNNQPNGIDLEHRNRIYSKLRHIALGTFHTQKTVSSVTRSALCTLKDFKYAKIEKLTAF